MGRLAPFPALRFASLLALAALANCSHPHGMQPPETLNPGPSRAHPTPGTRNPNRPAPPGVLPNPHANPQ
jgi:hypothetical protein